MRLWMRLRSWAKVDEAHLLQSKRKELNLPRSVAELLLGDNFGLADGIFDNIALCQSQRKVELTYRSVAELFSETTLALLMAVLMTLPAALKVELTQVSG
jgi:hypothetical protein